MGVVESRMLTACEDAPMAASGLDEALFAFDQSLLAENPINVASQATKPSFGCATMGA